MGFWKNSTDIIFPHNYENHDFKIIITAFVITIHNLSIKYFIYLKYFINFSDFEVMMNSPKSHQIEFNTISSHKTVTCFFYVTKKIKCTANARQVLCGVRRRIFAIYVSPLFAQISSTWTDFIRNIMDAKFQPLGSYCTRGFLP